MIVALAGGVGGARFLCGLAQVVTPEEITVIVNTGDDDEFHGLHVSPDADIITYSLAGVVDAKKGWGVADDTFECLASLGRLGRDTWFQLGDRDLATHIHRTDILRHGHTLSHAAASIAGRLGVRSRILPMSDQPVRTKIVTSAGKLDFQDYMVRRRAADKVEAVVFERADTAEPAPGVLEALLTARAIIICPSNPIISIGPILAVRGIREALRESAAPVAAISPIVGGIALKGPADRMLSDLGYRSSAAGVAALYGDFVDLFVIDQQDASSREQIEELGMKVLVTNTIMSGSAQKRSLAEGVVESLNAMERRGRHGA